MLARELCFGNKKSEQRHLYECKIFMWMLVAAGIVSRATRGIYHALMGYIDLLSNIHCTDGLKPMNTNKCEFRAP